MDLHPNWNENEKKRRQPTGERSRQVALSEEQERVLWLYHDYLRRCGFAVCRRKEAAPGALGTWRPVGVAGERGGKDLIAHFARWLELQEDDARGAH